jgi:hypothetical protein
MLDADGNTIEDQIVPNVHKLAESIFRFLEPAEVSMTQPQVREAISMLYIARIGHLRLQTLQHLLSPAIKRISQWDLIDNKIQELNSKSSDYRAACTFLPFILPFSSVFQFLLFIYFLFQVVEGNNSKRSSVIWPTKIL